MISRHASMPSWPRHQHIHDDHVRNNGLGYPLRLMPVACMSDDLELAGAFQQLLEPVSNEGMVIYQQNLYWCRRQFNSLP